MPLIKFISVPIVVHYKSQVVLFSVCTRVGFLSVRGMALVARATSEACTALTYFTAWMPLFRVRGLSRSMWPGRVAMAVWICWMVELEEGWQTG